jgi:predicted RNase H-like nuclease (RuvC/YqgF family)
MMEFEHLTTDERITALKARLHRLEQEVFGLEMELEEFVEIGKLDSLNQAARDELAQEIRQREDSLRYTKARIRAVKMQLDGYQQVEEPDTKTPVSG